MGIRNMALHKKGGDGSRRTERFSSEAPDRMTLRVQMSILEPARIFQAEPKQPVESNVSDPDERHQQWQMSASEKRVPAQHQRADIGVDGIVRHRPDTSVDDVNRSLKSRVPERAGRTEAN
jgi:hypothetical protein